MYSNVFIIYELSSARLAVLHGSSTTWFQTSRYCRAKVEFNSINWVRHGSSTTFETGLIFPILNVRDVFLDCLDLSFIIFKPPASRSRAYCDCNPIRAFDTFVISKEPISKTSRFCMFLYKRGCNWLGAIKAIWWRGFSRGSLVVFTLGC